MEDRELKAMSSIASAMADFGDGDAEVVERIVEWVAKRWGRRSPPQAVPIVQGGGPIAVNPLVQVPLPEDVAELFHSVNPTLEYERAIAVGFWFQEQAGRSDFTAAEVNSELRELGYRVGNITDAFNSAMMRKPALVMQVAKSGTSKQARKRYRLTQAGVRWVKERLATGATLSEEASE